MIKVSAAVLFYINLWSALYGINPHIPLAVGIIESSNNPNMESKTYTGFMGLHKKYVFDRFKIRPKMAKTIPVNTLIGTRALAIHLRGRTLTQALHKYNTECDHKYCKVVKEMVRELDEGTKIVIAVGEEGLSELQALRK